jgi:hypothetical protein
MWILLMASAVFTVHGAALVDSPWKYTTSPPANAWHALDFNDADWKVGSGGFGELSTPGSRVGTEWLSDDIWLRRPFHLDEIPQNPALYIHHDEGATIYINGQRIRQLEGFTTKYVIIRLSPKEKVHLKTGGNLMAIHCNQTSGGQFIDAHLIDANHIPKLPRPKGSSQPFKSKLITKWGKEVSAENAWREYPRPGFKREEWLNLNGHWKYAILPEQDSIPSTWSGEILVPYCVESKLSGVQRLLEPDESLWYRRTFNWNPKQGYLSKLNFEAVDYDCIVWVNGKIAGTHKGGNTPFSLDTTSIIKEGHNTITVKVNDTTDGTQLRGKQRLSPTGIWYTRVSGIWQTVWMEQVPCTYISDLKYYSILDENKIVLDPHLKNLEGFKTWIKAQAWDDEELISESQRIRCESGNHNQLVITIPNAIHWSPKSPKLYPIKLILSDNDGNTIDQIESYVAIRKIGKIRDTEGHLRFTLNNQPIFHWGPLDQGWWPDGLLTPPSDEALVSDILYLREAGFNMIRKHIKVEPRRFYYHCDRLGMMVWQDQVSAIKNPPWTRLKPDPEDALWTDDEHAQYMTELEAMIDTLENHPSIVVWVPFNEAWGQHRTVEVGIWTILRDGSRLVNVSSGGNFWPIGHIVDAHAYPHPEFPFDAERYDEKFIKVMGEFGGHGWPVLDHLWDHNKRNWGYGGLPQTLEECKERYRESIRRLVQLKKKGIAGGVYTQTTDVEGEINGLLTYDRAIQKIPARELREIHQILFMDEFNIDPDL